MFTEVIYTCPKCGNNLDVIMKASNPPIEEYRCSQCGWTDSHQGDVLRIPYPELNHLDNIDDFSIIPKPCRNCSNHPSNGGTGICTCTLGSYQIT